MKVKERNEYCYRCVAEVDSQLKKLNGFMCPLMHLWVNCPDRKLLLSSYMYIPVKWVVDEFQASGESVQEIVK